MKGVIFKAFEKFVIANWGDAFFEELIDATPAAGRGAFVGPGTYPDEVLVALLTTAVQKLGVAPEVALRSLGRFAFAELAAGLPGCTQGHVHPLTFLESIESIIHVEVRKLYPEARTPRILVERRGEAVRLVYESARRLCPLMIGLVEGACAAFGHDVQHEHVQCVHRGDARCEWNLVFQQQEVGSDRNALAPQAR